MDSHHIDLVHKQEDKIDCCICKEKIGVKIEPNCHPAHATCIDCQNKSQLNKCPICRHEPYVKKYCLQCGKQSDEFILPNKCPKCCYYEIKNEANHYKKMYMTLFGYMRYLIRLQPTSEQCTCNEISQFLKNLVMEI